MKNALKITLSSATIALGVLCLAPAAHAQKKTTTKTTKTTTTTKTSKTSKSEGFEKLPSGLEFKLVKHGTGTRKPVIGDHVEINIRVHIADSVLFDSRKMNNNMPVPFQVAKGKFKGDPVEGFMMMVAGDSSVMLVSVDSLKKAGNQLAPWMKEGVGQKIQYEVAMVSVKTDEEIKKETSEKAGKQSGIDDKILQDYFAKNNIKANKTASGLYYTILNDGMGEHPKAGQSVTVNYTGKTLDGKTFDSNVDSNFKHVQPFTFKLGMHQVIAGWDEGIALLKKGGKGTLYIPSPLAYGERGAGGAIGPNAVLMFDVEITNIEDAAAPAKN